MKQVTKREIWEEVQKDSFLLLLAKTFGAQQITTRGKTWVKSNQITKTKTTLS